MGCPLRPSALPLLTDEVGEVGSWVGTGQSLMLNKRLEVALHRIANALDDGRGLASSLDPLDDTPQHLTLYGVHREIAEQTPIRQHVWIEPGIASRAIRLAGAGAKVARL